MDAHQLADASHTHHAGHINLQVDGKLRRLLPRDEGIYDASFLIEALQARGKDVPKHFYSIQHSDSPLRYVSSHAPAYIDATAAAAAPAANSTSMPKDKLPPRCSLSCLKHAAKLARQNVCIAQNTADRAREAVQAVQEAGQAGEMLLALQELADEATEMLQQATAQDKKASSDLSEAVQHRETFVRYQLQTECIANELHDQLIGRLEQSETHETVVGEARELRRKQYKEYYRDIKNPFKIQEWQLRIKKAKDRAGSEIRKKSNISNVQPPVQQRQVEGADVPYYHHLHRMAHSRQRQLRQVLEDGSFLLSPMEMLQAVLLDNPVTRLISAIGMVHSGIAPFGYPGVTARDCLTALKRSIPAMFKSQLEVQAELAWLLVDLSDSTNVEPDCLGVCARQRQQLLTNPEEAKLLLLTAALRFLLASPPRQASRSRPETLVAQPLATEHLWLRQHDSLMVWGRTQLHRMGKMLLSLARINPHEELLKKQIMQNAAAEQRYQQQLQVYSASPYPDFSSMLKEELHHGMEMAAKCRQLLGGTQESVRSYTDQQPAATASQGLVLGQDVFDVSRSAASAPGLLGSGITVPMPTKVAASATVELQSSPVKAAASQMATTGVADSLAGDDQTQQCANNAPAATPLASNECKYYVVIPKQPGLEI